MILRCIHIIFNRACPYIHACIYACMHTDTWCLERTYSFCFQRVCRFKDGKKAKALRSLSNANACFLISILLFPLTGSETSSSESPEEVGLRSLQLLRMSTVQHVRLLSGRHKWSMTCRPVGSTFTQPAVPAVLICPKQALQRFI